MQDHIDFDLKTDLEYSKGAAKQIRILCPNFKAKNQRNYYSKLQVVLSEGIFAISQKTGVKASDVETADSNKMTAKELVMSLRIGIGEQFNAEVENFFKHNSVSLKVLGSGEPDEFITGMYDQLDPDDCNLIFGTFLVNFVMPSLIQ